MFLLWQRGPRVGCRYKFARVARLNNRRSRARFVEDELKEIADDLSDADTLLKGLVGVPRPGEPPDERKVWFVYVKVEKSVALLKLYLSVEKPGVFITAKSNPDDWSRLLATASDSLGEARRLLDQEKLEECLETLRTSRNGLRAFLRDRRKLRLSAARAAKRSVS